MKNNLKNDFDSEIADMVKLTDKIPNPIIKSGKNARSEIVVDGYNFDSNEELDFYYWVNEAKDFGFIDEFIHVAANLVHIFVTVFIGEIGDM